MLSMKVEWCTYVSRAEDTADKERKGLDKDASTATGKKVENGIEKRKTKTKVNGSPVSLSLPSETKMFGKILLARR